MTTRVSVGGKSGALAGVGASPRDGCHSPSLNPMVKSASGFVTSPTPTTSRGLAMSDLSVRAKALAESWVINATPDTLKTFIAEARDLVPALSAQVEKLEAQVGGLATFIMDEVPGEPSRSEGAIETTTRLLRELVRRNEQLQADVTRLEAEVEDWKVSDQMANNPEWQGQLLETANRELVIARTESDEMMGRLVVLERDQLRAEREQLVAALHDYSDWAMELALRCDGEWCVGNETFWDDRPVQHDALLASLDSPQ